ncbi:hypothetical protein DE146DRAFT_754809 [Phaeosphaeria sp. MPI-PUGE-AT-0046c]|nr:hypothetical protein DE146DRAFT_754809 [Phaeosphaeria sp. MPI-PUGE-AT-0046c]
MASLDIKDGAADIVDKQRPTGLAANLSPERRAQVEKKLKRKLDARCSLFVLIYIMNYLDRNNIAAARLGGLQEDLGIDDTQYATCLSILYVGYILMYVFTRPKIDPPKTCPNLDSPLLGKFPQI